MKVVACQNRSSDKLSFTPANQGNLQGWMLSRRKEGKAWSDGLAQPCCSEKQPQEEYKKKNVGRVW